MIDTFRPGEVVAAVPVPRTQAGTARAQEQKVRSKMAAVMEGMIIVC